MTVVERLRNRGVTPRAVLYARFSSDNQREESIEAQLRAMHEYCSRNSIVIIHEYCDRAKSATTDDRPEFLKMIAASREGDFDFAIVHKLDRFSRNRYDSAYYKRELKKNGVQLLSVLEQMDDSPESIILESVLEGMSEYYSKNLAREVMKGMRESAMDCRYIGGWIPYGFRVDPQTHRYIINDYEAEAVRMIFRDVADGCGYNVVLNKLNSMAIPSLRKPCMRCCGMKSITASMCSAGLQVKTSWGGGTITWTSPLRIRSVFPAGCRRSWMTKPLHVFR